MFKVNNKDTRLWTYFTPCSSVSIVNFTHVNADWANEFTVNLNVILLTTKKNFFN